MSIKKVRPVQFVVAMLSAATLLAGGSAVASGTPDNPGGHPVPWRAKTPVVSVDVTAEGGFQMPKVLHAGYVTFRFTTPENVFHAIQGFSLNPGATLDMAKNDIDMALSGIEGQTVPGMQGLYRDITEIGGAVTSTYGAQEVTIPLTAGTYYFVDIYDIDSPPIVPRYHEVKVVGAFLYSPLPTYTATIDATMSAEDPRFQGVPETFPHDGTFLNIVTGDEMHETVFRPVSDGITDDDITAYYDAVMSGGPRPPKPFTGLQAGLQSISPGRWAIVHLDLKPGRYAVVCYVPSDEDGMPHTFMGMHNVLTLT
ncbi:hypothetical protein [Labedaea rhizosphaerae]|uniref:Copper(I)-binding protein n=1 Tax=Labedaea rhizosphaerae TaxID=598644 RepID=A0A4R6SG92_LABRH|nr:hypothetical protein [Labedaea rhizosphaerae]TDP98126.1 hypothetical protein EV186_1031106 [Labedaea rhizosphaerae]